MEPAPRIDSHDSGHVDVEQKAVDDAHLRNTVVKTFAWQGVKVIVKDHKTKEPKAILDDVTGLVEAGK